MHADSTTAQEPGKAPRRPLRILIVGDTFPPNVNGAATFTAQLAAGMSARGHDVHVMVPAASRRHGIWQERYEDQSITAHRIPSQRWYPHDWLRFAWPWRARYWSRRVMDEMQPDVVHFQSVVVLGRGAVREASARGIRVIGTNHLMLENIVEHSLLPQFVQRWASQLWWKDATKTYHMAEAITTPTRRAARFLEKSAGLDHVLAISCGLRTKDYTADFSPKPKPRILFVGRVTGEKKIDVLLRAMAKLDPKLGAELDIVGGGDQRRTLEQLAKQLGIASRVTFHGYVSNEALRSFYTEATVFAMPSTAELQSIVTMEAMASGLPVVAANAMALPHLVREGSTGFLFKANDVDDLTEKLDAVLSMSHEERVEMGKAGYAFVQAHDSDRTFDLFERLYYGASIEEVAADSFNEQDHALDAVIEQDQSDGKTL